MIKVRKYLLSMLIQRLTTLIEVEEVSFYQMLYMDFLHRMKENCNSSDRSARLPR